jgi:hypothetical protein
MENPEYCPQVPSFNKKFKNSIRGTNLKIMNKSHTKGRQDNEIYIGKNLH